LNLDADKKLKLEKHNIYGYCFRISRADSGVIRNKSEFIEYATQKAGTYFATTALKELNNSWMDLSNQYDKKQNSLVKEVIGIVGKLADQLDINSTCPIAHVALRQPLTALSWRVWEVLLLIWMCLSGTVFHHYMKPYSARRCARALAKVTIYSRVIT
jgi:DNA mismatch repair ATPase MutS